MGPVSAASNQITGVIPAFSDITAGEPLATAANLNYFRANKLIESVQLSWETISEVTTAGFNLYRREVSGEFKKINDTLISTQVGGEALGAEYSYIDDDVEPGRRYEYKLEVIETSLQVASFALVTYWPYSVSLPFIQH